MSRNILHSLAQYSIEKVNEEDRIEYFKALKSQFGIDDSDHSLECLEARDVLKQEVRSLYTTYEDITYIIRYNGEFAGMFQLIPAKEDMPPEGKEIFIIKKFRKTKILPFVINYVVDFLCKDDKNIIVLRQSATGLQKLFIQEKTPSIQIVSTRTKERAREICRRMKNGTIQ